MNSIWGNIVVLFAIIVSPALAEDWKKESTDRSNRTALHGSSQVVRGDSGKWNDHAQLLLALPISQKPAKMSLDAWADEIQKKKFELTEKDDIWIIFRTEQLDDNDRVWIERIERRGQQITVVANQAKWQGKYFRNFTGYHVIGLNFGKLEPGKYDVKWVTQSKVFSKFEGDGKAIETKWPKDERSEEDKPTGEKPSELSLAISVKRSH